MFITKLKFRAASLDFSIKTISMHLEIVSAFFKPAIMRRYLVQAIHMYDQQKELIKAMIG